MKSFAAKVFLIFAISNLYCVRARAESTVSAALPVQFSIVGAGTQRAGALSFAGALFEYQMSMNSNLGIYLNYEINMRQTNVMLHGPQGGISYYIWNDSGRSLSGEKIQYVSRAPFSLQFILGFGERFYNFSFLDESNNDANAIRSQTFSTGTFFQPAAGFLLRFSTKENQAVFLKYTFGKAIFLEEKPISILLNSFCLGYSLSI